MLKNTSVAAALCLLLMACSSKDAKFFGTWNLDDRAAFTFNRDHTGLMVMPDGKQETITWKESKGNIQINIGNRQTFWIWQMGGKYIYLNKELRKAK